MVGGDEEDKTPEAFFLSPSQNLTSQENLMWGEKKRTSLHFWV